MQEGAFIYYFQSNNVIICVVQWAKALDPIALSSSTLEHSECDLYLTFITPKKKKHIGASPHLCGNTCITIKNVRELGRVFKMFKSRTCRTMFKGIQKFIINMPFSTYV